MWPGTIHRSRGMVCSGKRTHNRLHLHSTICDTRHTRHTRHTQLRHYRTSAKSGEGVDELFAQLAEDLPSQTRETIERLACVPAFPPERLACAPAFPSYAAHIHPAILHLYFAFFHHYYCNFLKVFLKLLTRWLGGAAVSTPVAKTPAPLWSRHLRTSRASTPADTSCTWDLV